MKTIRIKTEHGIKEIHKTNPFASLMSYAEVSTRVRGNDKGEKYVRKMMEKGER